MTRTYFSFVDLHVFKGVFVIATIKVKLIGFPEDVKEEFIILNDKDFYDLHDQGNIYINNKPYTVKNKRMCYSSKSFQVTFDK